MNFPSFHSRHIARIALSLTFLLFVGTWFGSVKLPRLPVHPILSALGLARGELLWTVHQFSAGTSINSLAARKDGQLLATLASAPEVWLIDPIARRAELVHRFEGRTAVFGVAETERDVFVVAAGNWTLEGLGEVGSWSIHTIDMSDPQHGAAMVEKIAEIPQMRCPGGIAVLPSQPGAVLVADSTMGSIYRVDNRTGKATVTIKDTPLEPRENAVVALGVSSISVQQEGTSKGRENWYLYFTKTFGGPMLGRIPLKSDGTAGGPGEVIVKRAPGDVEANDFVADVRGGFWVASNLAHGVFRVDARSVARIPVALAGKNVLTAASAVAFGRTEKNGNILYVATKERTTAPERVEAARIVALGITQLRARKNEY